MWRDQLDELETRGLRRRLRPLSSPPAAAVIEGGRRLLNLASNNYLGLADHPAVVAAACDGARRWGVGAGASRLVCGDNDLLHALEADLAELKGTEAALVFSSGYAANVGVITALAGRDDHLFCDRLNHASLIDGARLSGARRAIYRHRDMNHLEDLLRTTPSRGRRLILSDGVFSMDGVLAPLPELVDLAERYHALLVVDDAHGTGVVGPDGRGSVQHFGLDGRVPVQLATLSKAVGVQGGFAAVSADLRELLIHRSRSFVFSTGLSPMVVAAARAALSLARSEGWRRERQQARLGELERGLRARGYDVLWQAPAPMLLALTGSPASAVQLSARLEGAGVWVPAIRPPTVPEGASRLRFTPTAEHTGDDMERVLAALPTTTGEPSP